MARIFTRCTGGPCSLPGLPAAGDAPSRVEGEAGTPGFSRRACLAPNAGARGPCEPRCGGGTVPCLTVPCAPQSLATRLKENMEKLTEERDQRTAAESREKEQNKRLQRQLRDVKEEMGELAKKETEASRKKHELVSSPGGHGPTGHRGLVPRSCLGSRHRPRSPQPSAGSLLPCSPRWLWTPCTPQGRRGGFGGTGAPFPVSQGCPCATRSHPFCLP